MDAVKSIFLKLLWITFALALIILAWRSSLGKGLAAIVSPMSLEVDFGQQAQNPSVS